jgi:hypothetical protein
MQQRQKDSLLKSCPTVAPGGCRLRLEGCTPVSEASLCSNTIFRVSTVPNNPCGFCQRCYVSPVAVLGTAPGFERQLGL